MTYVRGLPDDEPDSKRRHMPVGDADDVPSVAHLARSGALFLDVRSRCGSGRPRNDRALCELRALGAAIREACILERRRRRLRRTRAERRPGARLVRRVPVAARNRLIVGVVALMLSTLLMPATWRLCYGFTLVARAAEPHGIVRAL